jgi:hypothetical protein
MVDLITPLSARAPHSPVPQALCPRPRLHRDTLIAFTLLRKLTLCYVYLENGTFVNAEIIRQGGRFSYKRFPFKYLEKFRTLEREARWRW